MKPPAAATLALARQLMTAVALMHDYGPDIFHGAMTPERLILPGDGRVVVCEHVLGSAFEQAVPAWGVGSVWRDWRVPMLADASLGRYGRRVDLVQIGLVVLQFLLGRPLSGTDYPEGLPRVFEEAVEAPEAGQWPGPDMRAWLASLLFPERPETFRTLVEAQKGLGLVVLACQSGEVSPSHLQAFVDHCEGMAWRQRGEIPRPSTPTPSTLVSAAAMLDAVSAREGAPDEDPAASLSAEPEAPAEAPADDALDTDWFTPRSPDQDLQQAGSWESVPAFPMAPEPSPIPPDLGVDIPALPASGEPPAPEPDPPEEQAVEQERPEVRAAELEPPEPPVVAKLPAAPSGEEGARPVEPPPSAPAVRRPVSRAKSVARPRVLSGRSHPRWQTLAIAACAVLLVAVGAFVGPMAWTRLMGRDLPTGRLAVQSDPAGAEIVLDGKVVGPTPATLEAAAGQHHVEVRIGGSSRAAWVSVPENGQLLHRVSMPEAAVRGGLHLVTDPPGGTIWVDGSDWGKSPARVVDLAPGPHRVSASGPFGPVEEQEVSVVGGAVTSVTVPTVGWLRIRSPYSLVVSEKGRAFGATTGQALMVPAGRHHFDLSNSALALKVRQFVDVPPGKVVTVPFEAPMGMMNLSSDEPAEVWLDGRLIGHTPLMTLPATLGSHEVVFRHARLGDVSYTVNVTLAAPVRLVVTFNKKQHP